MSESKPIEKVRNRKEKLKKTGTVVKTKMFEETTDFWHDFKSFAFKGDVIDLAVGIVIGTGFNKIVQSLASDIIMPFVGKVVGNVAFSHLYWNLSSQDYESLQAAEAAGAPIVKYGQFLTNLVDFLILALTIFVVLRYVLRYRKEKKAEEGN